MGPSEGAIVISMMAAYRSSLTVRAGCRVAPPPRSNSTTNPTAAEAVLDQRL